MQEVRKLIEYGVPIDPEAMVSPPEATELELEPGHPGLGDKAYIERRKQLFELCRRHRLPCDTGSALRPAQCLRVAAQP